MSLLPHIYYAGHRVLRWSYGAARRIWSGWGLGVLQEADLKTLDRLDYHRNPLYQTAAHLLAGLWDWEARLLERHLSAGERVAVLGAGTGREALALSKQGLGVDAYEAQDCLRETGNRLLAQVESPLRILPMPYNGVPATKEAYDAILLGWGMLSGVSGRTKRLALLHACRERLCGNGFLFASYLLHHENEPRHTSTIHTANLLRQVLGRQPCEPGDRLDGGFAHRFQQAEVEDELRRAGFTVLDHHDAPYPHLAAQVLP